MALNSIAVERAMKGRQANRKVRAAPSAQLDLFSRPVSPAPIRQIVQPASPRPVTELVAAPPKADAVDPLIDLVLGPGKSRGRPEKVPAISGVALADQDRLLDVREAAHCLGLSKSTLDKMRCSGRGPRFIRASDRAIRYDRKDLQAFADERRRRSTSELAGLVAT
jgi:predicted DNA-binding transcriptional regulator AlpA